MPVAIPSTGCYTILLGGDNNRSAFLSRDCQHCSIPIFEIVLSGTQAQPMYSGSESLVHGRLQALQGYLETDQGNWGAVCCDLRCIFEIMLCVLNTCEGHTLACQHMWHFLHASNLRSKRANVALLMST